MRMEFFIGEWMEPKMELYAITHTFSAAMISLLIHNIVCFSDPAGADNAFLLFAFGNWFVFNVFEFGRKTFANEEEREGVDSYSKRLKPGGAVILLLVNIVAAFVCLYFAASMKFAANLNHILVSAGIVSALVAVSGIIYSLTPNLKFAKLYRGTVTLYLLAYPAAIAIAIYLNVYK
jgi:4-hydroxybenzoate polyprenyltransferase